MALSLGPWAAGCLRAGRGRGGYMGVAAGAGSGRRTGVHRVVVTTRQVDVTCKAGAVLKL